MFRFAQPGSERLAPALIIFAAASAMWTASAGQGLAAASVHKNDGRWSIEVITDKGECDRAYRYSVLIDKGEARYGGSEPIVVSGKVAPNGSVRGSIAYGDNRANVVGSLSEGWGKGQWTWQGSRTCSGHWNAEKRG
jgi:hypothetical protein